MMMMMTAQTEREIIKTFKAYNQYYE